MAFHSLRPRSEPTQRWLPEREGSRHETLTIYPGKGSQPQLIHSACDPERGSRCVRRNDDLAFLPNSIPGRTDNGGTSLTTVTEHFLL